MTELTQVILQMHANGRRTDIYAGPLCGFFYKIRGHPIKYHFVLESFRLRKVQKEIAKERPNLTFHPISADYPGWRNAIFNLSPSDVERALLERDPEIYGLAKKWLPVFKPITGLRFPPNGKNDFLYRVYLSIGQKCTEAKQVLNTQRAVTAYGNRIIRKEGMQAVIKGGVVAVVEGITNAPPLPSKPQHQLEDYTKALNESWNANFFERNNNHKEKPHREGHKNVRCPKCNTWLTSGPGTPCRKCGWKE